MACGGGGLQLGLVTARDGVDIASSMAGRLLFKPAIAMCCIVLYCCMTCKALDPPTEPIRPLLSTRAPQACTTWP